MSFKNLWGNERGQVRIKNHETISQRKGLCTMGTLKILYRKVAKRSKSCLKFSDLLCMKERFDVNLLWPLRGKSIFGIVIRSSVCDSTVISMAVWKELSRSRHKFLFIIHKLVNINHIFLLIRKSRLFNTVNKR